MKLTAGLSRDLGRRRLLTLPPTSRMNHILGRSRPVNSGQILQQARENVSDTLLRALPLSLIRYFLKYLG